MVFYAVGVTWAALNASQRRFVDPDLRLLQVRTELSKQSVRYVYLLCEHISPSVFISYLVHTVPAENESQFRVVAAQQAPARLEASHTNTLTQPRIRLTTSPSSKLPRAPYRRPPTTAALAALAAAAAAASSSYCEEPNRTKINRHVHGTRKKR